MSPFVLMLIEAIAHRVADAIDVVRRALAKQRMRRVEGR